MFLNGVWKLCNNKIINQNFLSILNVPNSKIIIGCWIHTSNNITLILITTTVYFLFKIPKH